MSSRVRTVPSLQTRALSSGAVEFVAHILLRPMVGNIPLAPRHRASGSVIRVKPAHCMHCSAPLGRAHQRYPLFFKVETGQLDLKALLYLYTCGRWALMLHGDIERDKSTLRGAVC